MKKMFLLLGFLMLGLILMGCQNSVPDDTLDSNADLISIILSTGQLDKPFDSNLKNYTVSVKASIDSITISGVKANTKATVTDPIVLTNLIPNVEQSANLIVTAQNGTQKIYIVTVIRDNLPQKLDKIFYSNHRKDIYAINIDGTGKKLLLNGTNSDNYTNPIFIRKTNKIMFLSEYNEEYNNILIMNEDGSNIVNITNNTETKKYYYDPDVSSDGTKIIFSMHNSTGSGIYIMNIDGTNQITLISPDGNNVYYDLSYSPDSSNIIYHTYDDNKEYININIIEISSLNITNITKTTTVGYKFNNPKISPNGQKIVYCRGDISGIFSMNIDGTSQQVLFEPVLNKRYYEPTYNSNGTKIVFIENTDKIYTNLMIMNVDGSGIVNITSNTGESEYHSNPRVY